MRHRRGRRRIVVSAEERRQQAALASHQDTCRNHKRFTSYEAAVLHYAGQVREGKADPGQEIYHCGACGQFHHGGSGAPSLGRLLGEDG